MRLEGHSLPRQHFYLVKIRKMVHRSGYSRQILDLAQEIFLPLPEEKYPNVS